jgi:hypothetical protein
MRVFLAAVVLWLFGGNAGAHIGNENSTEVRVHADSMRVVLRTSIPFAWSLLGENPPAMADEAGQAVALPLLIAAAPSLLTVTAAGNPMTPTFVNCMFELQDDVAFIYNFKRPADWPVEVKIGFFNRLGDLDSGTIAVFDYMTSRFARDVEPLAQKSVDRNDPSLSFTLEPSPPPPAAKPASVPPPPREAPPRMSTGKEEIMVVVFLLLGVGGIVILACRRLAE